MQTISVVNWYKPNKMIGGCESIADEIVELVKSKSLNVNYLYPNKTQKLFYNGNLEEYFNFDICVKVEVIQKYLDTLKEIKELANLYISNDCCIPFDKEVNLITIAQNPYLDCSNIFYDQGYYNLLNYAEFARVYVLLQREQFKNSKIIIAPSFYMIDYISRVSNQDEEVINKIKFIPHGIDIEFFKPLENKKELREMYNIPLDKKVVVWVGSKHPVKGWKEMTEIIKSRPELYFICVFKHGINRKAESKNVSIFCNLPKDKMRDIYNCSDLYISLAPFESFNLAACEALACNIPIVTTNSGIFWDKDLELAETKKYGTLFNYNYVGKITDIIDTTLIKSYEPRNWLIEHSLTKTNWCTNMSNLITNNLDVSD